MRTLDLIKRAGRSLKTAKLRTLLTALAISVGGFTLTLTLGAGNGVRDYTTDLVQSNFDPAELIVGRDPEVSNSGSPSDSPQEYDESISSFQSVGGDSSFQFKQVSRSDINALENREDVDQVRENYTISIQYVTRAGQRKYTGSVIAYNPAQKPEVKAGSIPDDGDIAAGTVLLPDTYLELFGFSSGDEALGESIDVVVSKDFNLSSLTNLANGQDLSSLDISQLSLDDLGPEERTYTFVIAGVTTKPATSLSFGTTPIVVSSTDAKIMYEFVAKGTDNFDKFLYVSVRVKDGENKEVRDTVKASLESDGYYVQTAEDIQATITQFVNILQGLVGALGAITLVASIFGIINTQYISVLERTREIGLMKALGMSRKNISRLFIFEAAWIGFIGGLLGIVGGIVLGLLINPWVTRSLDLGEGNSLIIFDVLQLVILLTSLMLVGALAGLLPARKAAKLDPVEALRTE
jgi:putative ABC transport system permease protein